MQQFRKNDALNNLAESCSQPIPKPNQTQSKTNLQSPGTSMDTKE